MTFPDAAKPATAIAVNGLRDDDRFAGEIITTILLINAQAQQPRLIFALAHAVTANGPFITGIRRGPGGVASLKSDWLVTVNHLHRRTHAGSATAQLQQILRCVILRRFGVTFAPMLQDDWSAIVEAAIAEGGAS